ncbi:MAG: YebC/PmpR family DNA-binding transcriptional regulator [Ruminococcaceae bacterium]|nr:YebC/PmpR family DNA-binding transcriptional regulator [Oscillospiraceae bacterium]
MSGHSKWHNIQKTKGAQDAKRAQIFTKIAKEISVAVKEGGGGSPDTNARLATVITKAKAANMPNDNIKRAIDKAMGSGGGDNIETIVYEGYGPGGVAIIVETLTDNRNRTASNVRHAFDKHGGNMGTTGCVSWSFERKGIIVVNNEDGDIGDEQIFEDALEAGAEDVSREGDVFEIVTSPDDVSAVAEYLDSKGYSLLSAQAEMVPDNFIKLDDEEGIKNIQKMLDMFDDDEDVQDVWHNWEEEN